jgi:hypothetical protein
VPTVSGCPTTITGSSCGADGADGGFGLAPTEYLARFRVVLPGNIDTDEPSANVDATIFRFNATGHDR